MTTTLPEIAPDQWIMSRLNGDSSMLALVGSGRFFQDQMPEDENGTVAPQLFPAVVYGLYLPRTHATINGRVFLLDADYLIKAVGNTPYMRDIEPIAARIHDLFYQAAGTTVSRGAIYGTDELRGHRQITTESGVQYRELGYFYRIFSQGR